MRVRSSMQRRLWNSLTIAASVAQLLTVAVVIVNSAYTKVRQGSYVTELLFAAVLMNACTLAAVLWLISRTYSKRGR